MKQSFLLLLFCLPLFLLQGCNSGGAKPEGFPEKLVSCTLTFTQDGQPLQEAIISLLPASEADRNWSAGGMTLENGVVRIYTYSKWEGVPPGTYKVTVSKSITETVKGQDVDFPLVNPDYGNRNKTPFTLEITGKTTQTFEVGPVPARK